MDKFSEPQNREERLPGGSVLTAFRTRERQGEAEIFNRVHRSDPERTVDSVLKGMS